MSFVESRESSAGRWRPLSLILSLGVISWLVGRGAFALVQRWLPQSQIETLAFWSAVASLLLLPVAVTPILLEGHRYRPTPRSLVPLMLTALGFLPVTVMGGIWGSGDSPLAAAPVAMTCLTGLVLAAFGAGYAVQSRQR